MIRRDRATRVVGVVALGILLLLGVPGPGAATAATAASTPSTASGRTSPGIPARAPDSTSSSTTPLRVRLDTLAPAALRSGSPARGRLTLSGTVRNVSDEPWADVNVIPFASASPITTRDQLAAAVATQPEVAVGQRITDPGSYAQIADLEPGQSKPFRIRLPVADLGITGEPGVYWIGVHALGTSADGRDLVADGRARTFIPLVDDTAARDAPAPVSVVLPLRQAVARAEDGSLARPDRWGRLTSARGRLTRLAGFAASAGDAPLTWVVDPAVLDALGDFVDGNPVLPLRAAGAGDDTREGATPGSQSAQPTTGSDSGSSAEPGAASDAESGGSAPEPGRNAPPEAQRAAADAVLRSLTGSLRAGNLLRVGYADPDVAALARQRPRLLQRAEELGSRSLAARDLTAAPVVAPPEGYFDGDLLDRLSADATLLLTDEGRLDRPAASRLSTGQDLVLADARASAGGPAPTRAHDPLALRQRLLAEASLEAGTEAPRPVVLTLPSRWNPGAGWRDTDFFETLRSTPWVRLSTLPQDSTPTAAEELPYPHSQQADELGARGISAARTLLRTAAVVHHLLDEPGTVTDRLTGAALTATSLHARARPRASAARVLALDSAVRRQLDRIQITGTDFVLLSGGSGSPTVTLVNGLDVRVTVGIGVRAGATGVRVEAPDPVTLGPGQRSTTRLSVSSPPGVHDVRLVPVTDTGLAAGTPFTFSLRTSEVSRLIWYFLAAGAGLFVVMIVRRVALRVRNRRWRLANEDTGR